MAALVFPPQVCTYGFDHRRLQGRLVEPGVFGLGDQKGLGTVAYVVRCLNKAADIRKGHNAILPAVDEKELFLFRRTVQKLGGGQSLPACFIGEKSEQILFLAWIGTDKGTKVYDTIEKDAVIEAKWRRSGKPKTLGRGQHGEGRNTASGRPACQDHLGHVQTEMLSMVGQVLYRRIDVKELGGERRGRR